MSSYLLDMRQHDTGRIIIYLIDNLNDQFFIFLFNFYKKKKKKKGCDLGLESTI